jgi:hypothetical protein
MSRGAFSFSVIAAQSLEPLRLSTESGVAVYMLPLEPLGLSTESVFSGIHALGALHPNQLRSKPVRWLRFFGDWFCFESLKVSVIHTVGKGVSRHRYDDLKSIALPRRLRSCQPFICAHSPGKRPRACLERGAASSGL